MQKRALEEQQQFSRENPIVQAAVQGKPIVSDNLLDIDFDGTAPASAAQPDSSSANDLADLFGSPSPPTPANAGTPAPGGASAMDDLFSSLATPNPAPGPANGANELMGGLAGLDLNDNSSSPAPGGQPGQKKMTNEDILGLF